MTVARSTRFRRRKVRLSTLEGRSLARALVVLVGAFGAVGAAFYATHASSRSSPASVPVVPSRTVTTSSTAPDFLLGGNEPGGIDDADVWMMATVAMIPIMSVIFLVGTYFWTESNGLAIIAGVLIAVVMIGTLYWIYLATHFNKSQHASVEAYNELVEQMSHITSVLLPDASHDPSLQVAGRTAHTNVSGYARAFEFARHKTGLHWILGKGYLDLLRLVHRAEEALIMYEPVDMVLSDGWKDLGRISGSTLPHAEDRLAQVRRALSELSPPAHNYLPPVSSCPDPGVRPALHVDAGANSLGAEPLGRFPITTQTQARVILRDVRFSLNDFRDSRKAGLIDARNDLVARMFLTALATSLLLVFIVISQPPKGALMAGAILYAIGAIVGLFSRLYADLSQGDPGRDYGIAYVRLFQTFLLSGLAAVAGVYIAVALPVALDNAVLRPPLTDAAIRTVASPGNPAPQPVRALEMPRLVNVYDIEHYPAGIVLAAIFGLTPGLLLSRLAQGVEQYKEDLRSSEPVPTGVNR